MGIYYAHVRKWLSIVPRNRFMFLTLEELGSNFEQNIVHDLLEFLSVRTDISSNHEMMKQIANSCAQNSQASVNYKHDPRLRMRSDTKLMLEEFYRPFNSLLVDLLGSEQFMWS